MASEVSYLRNQNALTLEALICVLCAFKILLSDSVNKYSRNLLVKMEMKSQGYTFLAGFFWGRHLSMCKLQCELVATAALFAHIPVVRAKILFFSFDYGGKLHTQAASTAHSLRCGTFTPRFTCRVFVCLHPETALLRALKGNLVAPVNCFLPEASTNLLGPAPWGVAIGFCIRWCLYFY